VRPTSLRSSHPRPAKTVKRTLVHLRNSRAGTCSSSRTGTVGTVSLRQAMRSQHRSTCFHASYGGISVSSHSPSSFVSQWCTNSLSGIMWAYIMFNFAVVFVCTWLYLGGARKTKSVFSPSARKEKANARRKKQQSEGAV
jgi:hypothetical protein